MTVNAITVLSKLPDKKQKNVIAMLNETYEMNASIFYSFYGLADYDIATLFSGTVPELLLSARHGLPRRKTDTRL